jgi:hypothetical protein
MAKTRITIGAIGQVTSSMLTEAQFQAINGTGWVLMDGRSVAGSSYAIVTGNATIPDARGMVLRGKNNGRSDGNQNPAGDNALGLFEDDRMQGHRHSLRGNSGGGSAWNLAGSNASVVGGGSPGTGDTYVDILAASSAQAISAPIANAEGTPRIGVETRMKNITVNHFIKIN